MEEFKSALRLHLGTTALVILGGLVLLTRSLVDVDPLGIVFGQTGGTYAQMIIGLAALYMSLQRSTWLPFLGPTVLPTSITIDSIADAPLSTLNVSVPNDNQAQKIIYWAAMPGKNVVSDATDAYGDFANARVISLKGQEGPTVLLPIAQPAPYTVRGRQLSPHVHYRYIYAGGIIGRVQTVPSQ